MKKILILSYGESNKNGGVASICDLANILVELGHNVTFASPLSKFDRLIYGQKLLSDDVNKVCIQAKYLDSEQYLFKGMKLFVVNLLSKFMRKFDYEKFDLVIDSIGLSSYIIKMFKLDNTRVIRNHAGSPEAFYNFFLKFVCDEDLNTRIITYTRIMKRYSGGLFQSYSHMKEFLHYTDLPTCDSIFIAPTVNKYFDTYLQSSSNKLINKNNLIMIGSIQPRKGQLEALHILVTLNKNSKVKYNIKFKGNILDNNYFLKMKDFINKNSLKEHVSFDGFSSNYIKDLSESYILLILSESEGVPRVVRESLSVDVPVIGYKFGDICNDIEFNNAGFFVDFRDNFSLLEYILSNSVDKLDARNGYELIFSRNKYLSTVKYYIENI